MNATYVPERDVYVCPVCKGDLNYWTSYDVLICLRCEDQAYDPDTGEVRGLLG